MAAIFFVVSIPRVKLGENDLYMNYKRRYTSLINITNILRKTNSKQTHTVYTQDNDITNTTLCLFFIAMHYINV